MPSLKDVKMKIVGVGKTKQITKAMNMVASAKLRGAQARIERFRPYAGKYRQVLAELARKVEDGAHPLLAEHQEKKRCAIVLVTSDRGLCGGFNANIVNAALKLAAEKRSEGMDVQFACVGRKGRDAIRSAGQEITLSYGDRMGSVDFALASSVALEMIHTYSLIHDDLPAMDNDDLRRGRPSNHRAFDEATAILAGDALQADAFYSMTLCDLPAGQVLAALRAFATAAGSTGMCGGQELDMQWTGQTVQLSDLEHLHALKTGAILRASVVCGALLAGAWEDALEALSAYGASLGVAFQIADDILDVVSDTETLGKPAGSDEEQHKNTYPSILGLERSRELAHEYARRAQDALRPFEGDDAAFLKGLALYTVERVN